MARIIWTDGALNDLKDETRPFIKDAPKTAERLVDRIMAAPRILEALPTRGWVVPEFGIETFREILEGPYRVLYRIVGDDVFIVGVCHGRRNVKRRFRRQDLESP